MLYSYGKCAFKYPIQYEIHIYETACDLLNAYGANIRISFHIFSNFSAAYPSDIPPHWEYHYTSSVSGAIHPQSPYEAMPDSLPLHTLGEQFPAEVKRRHKLISEFRICIS